MADWTDVSDSEVDPDAPLTSELAYAWRDNVIAAFEGAPGSPGLRTRALWNPTAGGALRLVVGDGSVSPAGTGLEYTLSATAFSYGTITVNASAIISSGSIGSMYITRTRTGSTTNLVTAALSTSTMTTRTFDVSVQPHDRLGVAFSRNAPAAAVTINFSNVNFCTAGQDLWLLDFSPETAVLNNLTP